MIIFRQNLFEEQILSHDMVCGVIQPVSLTNQNRLTFFSWVRMKLYKVTFGSIRVIKKDERSHLALEQFSATIRLRKFLFATKF